MRASRLLPVLLLGVSTAPGVAAGFVPPSLVERAQDRDDGFVLYAIHLLERLRLAPSQLDRFLPLYEQACSLHVAFHADQREAVRLALAAYPPYLKEKRLDQGITPSVEEAAVEAHSRLKKIQLEYDAALLSLERQLIEDLLSPGQRRIAETYQPSRSQLRDESGAARGARGRLHRHHASRPRDVQDSRTDLLSDPTSHRLESLRDELARLEAFSHPRPGLAGRLLFSPRCAGLYYAGAGRRMPVAVQQAVRLLASDSAGNAATALEQDLRRVIDLKNDINDWNLVNGLRLTATQIAVLTPLCVRGATLLTDSRDARTPPTWRDVELHRLETAVRSVLQPGQCKVLDQFSTCFKGKPSLRDPVRIGQAHDETAMEAWLERARALDEAALRRAIDHRVDSEERRLSGPLTPVERNARVSALHSTVEQARRLDHVDFALNRSDLARSVSMTSRAFQISHEMEQLKTGQGKPGKITRLMFTPGFVTAIRERGRQLAHPELARTSPGVHAPKAENCDRTCSLPE